jgi:hypothetical protein
VRGVVHLLKLFRARFSIAAPGEFRPQLDPRDGKPPFVVLLHEPDRRVLVGIEHKLLLAGDRQKREHVTARDGSDKRLFRIDVRRIAQKGRGSRSCHGMAAVEAPGMIARILLVGKLGVTARPFQGSLVLGHA